MLYKIVLAIIFFPLTTFAQDVEEVDWASPSVEGMQLGKGIIFSYKRMSPYDIVTESQVPELVDDAEANIERIRNLTFKMRIPIVAADRSQFVIGFEYNVDQFEFEDVDKLDYEFYRALNQRNLIGRGVKLYYNHSYNDKNYIFIRVSAELNGDVPSDQVGHAFRSSLAAVYGWKISPKKTYGVGFYASYNFGRPLVLPALVYNNTWTDKWGIEAAFPASVMFRYNLNNRNLLYFGYEVEGGSYNIELGNTLNERFDHIQVRRSEVMPRIAWERELYDFIWFSLEAGTRFNINFNITEDDIFQEKRILKNDVSAGVFIGANLFILPTESLKKFFKKDK